MDLKLNLQSRPGRTTMDYAVCLREVAAAAKASGKACGLLCRQTDHLPNAKRLASPT